MKNRFVAQQANRTGGVKHQITRGEIIQQHGRTMKTSKTQHLFDHNPRRSTRLGQKKDHILKDRNMAAVTHMQQKQIAGQINAIRMLS